MSSTIEQLNKEITENEFKLKTAENILIENLDKIKELGNLCSRLGILTEGQKGAIESLTKDDLLNTNSDSFKDLSETLTKISNELDSKITEIEIHMKSLETV